MEIYRVITSTEVETVIENLPKNKKPGRYNFTAEFYQTLKDLIHIHVKPFPCQKKKKKLWKGIQPNSC